MRRSITLMMTLVVVVSIAAVPMTGLAALGDGVQADSHGSNDSETNSTDGNASVAPGERLSGIVGVQEAELEGEVDKRAFGLSVARANSNNSKADIVASQYENVQQRIGELKERQQELNESLQNGSISEGKYRAQIAKLGTQIENAKTMANETSTASQGLPADLLESKGINATAIQTLKDNAGQLGGKQVSEIARSIAGPAAGPGDRGPGDRGPGSAPGDAGPGQGMDDDNMTDGDVTDGNITDGNMTDGNVTDGNVTDGNMTDANTTETNTTATASDA